MESVLDYIIMNKIISILIISMMIIALGTVNNYSQNMKSFAGPGEKIDKEYAQINYTNLKKLNVENDGKQSANNLSKNNNNKNNSSDVSNKSSEKDKNKLVASKEAFQNLQKKKTEVKRVKNDSSKTQHILDAKSLGISDLIIDHTQSKWGRDFVDLFNKYWNPPSHIGDYTIIIEERPMPRFGTVILIKVNGNYIYQKFIQPRYETIKMNAANGTRLTLSYLINYRRIQNELQGEDMKGTGIY